jgi:hypothetical protein
LWSYHLIRHSLLATPVYSLDSCPLSNAVRFPGGYLTFWTVLVRCFMNTDVLLSSERQCRRPHTVWGRNVIVSKTHSQEKPLTRSAHQSPRAVEASRSPRSIEAMLKSLFHQGNVEVLVPSRQSRRPRAVEAISKPSCHQGNPEVLM